MKASGKLGAGSEPQRADQSVLKSTRGAPEVRAVASRNPASITRTPRASTTTAAPTKNSSGSASMVAPPGTKWIGGSTCVPVWVLIVSRERFEACPWSRSEMRSIDTVGSPGQVSMPGPTGTDTSMSFAISIPPVTLPRDVRRLRETDPSTIADRRRIVAEIVIYGASWCPDCRRAKKFLGDQRIPYAWHDLETEPELAAEVQARNDGKNVIPTIVFPDGSHLSEPTNEELADKLGIQRMAVMHVYDLIIVGGGPAALTTSIYAARENLETLIIDSKGLGGQAGVTERLDNYPGFPDGIGGADLADRFVKQAQRYGVEMLQAVSVTSITDEATANSTWRPRRAITITRARSCSRPGSSYRRTTPTERTT